MSSESILSVRGISKRFELYAKPRDRLLQFLAGGRRQFFHEVWALRDISFELARGECVGLIGQNGSGKSTLLQIVTGTLTPTQGDVRIGGRVAALLELGAGFDLEATGRENVYMNAAILGVPRQQMERRIVEVLEFSELGEFIDQPVKTYSSGMYARLAFSAAIHVDPDVLIVDETLSVGDARFVAKCMRRIQELKARGTSILFVSHDTTSVRTLCDRAIWIDKGRMVEDGEVFPVTGRYTEFMFRDELATAAAEGGAPAALAAPAAPEAGPVPEAGPAAVEVATEAPAEAPVAAPAVAAPPVLELPVPAAASRESIDARPVTHWGSRKGIVTAAFLRNAAGERRDLFTWGETIEALVRVNIPADVPRENLVVSMSIKDLRGADLMVSTTHDLSPQALPEASEVEVGFRFRNCLTPGKYLLVAAIEKRQGTDIYYYEYIEGAHYFASTSDRKMFGVFRPEVEQRIESYAELDL